MDGKTPSKLGSWMAVVIVTVPLLIIAYLISPLFLPRWRWSNMGDWETLSARYKQPAAKLQQKYDVIVRYHPRADGDPLPWQLLTSTPLYDPDNDEERHAVRVTLISDRTGEPPSQLRIGSANYRDVFFKGSVWRFPPGSFGFNRFRPVVIFESSTFDKLESREAYGWDGEMKEKNWSNDDEDVEDGFTVPATN